MKIMLTNVPPERSDAIARTLVDEGLAACINAYPVKSYYHWEGSPQVDDEVTLMMKVAAARTEALKSRVLELHPYELPEIVVLEVDRAASLDGYVRWVREQCKPRGSES